MKTLCIIIAVVALATFVNAGVAVRGEEPIDWYDCSKKEDGNYKHPRDCSGFIHCSSGLAFEEFCAVCVVSPVTCPDGKLRFSEQTGQCTWANEVTC